MKHIVLFGAGKSATCLIDYLLRELLENSWRLTVFDSNSELVQSKIGNAENAFAVSAPVEDDKERTGLIQSADIVISLLPPELHFIVARDCVAHNKNLLTASYIDENTRSLEKEINDKGLLFLCEMGLDPGIDHMSAMKLIRSVKDSHGRITSFRSHCGGLISPESDNNPWHYKVTWNPKNVVLAGKDGATYLKDNQTVRVPYQKIFRNYPPITVPGLHPLWWYPNRDSMHYISLYDLNGIATFLRTTLRYPSFCRGWRKFIAADCTSTRDIEQIKHCKTFKEWFDAKVRPYVSDDIAWTSYLQLYITDPHKNEFNTQLNYFGYNSNEPLPEHFTCSADILQYFMETKLTMQPDDKDMVVMVHEIEYEDTGSENCLKKGRNSYLVLKGDNSVRTAMAKAVGLPLGIAAKLVLQDKIRLNGLHIPVVPEIYDPVLKELAEHGISFTEAENAL